MRPKYRLSIYTENGWEYLAYCSYTTAHQWYDMERSFGYLCMLTLLN